ncbi:MAG: hypothetical protein O3B01_19120 [Planctomycetota bacterium]|nr:hypothetical protein [Planctomycetota bacterium]MDA1140684.1 hypothetical protein [Planctomycetota bacterium]
MRRSLLSPSAFGPTPIGLLLLVVVAIHPAWGETLLSNLDPAKDGEQPSPFHQGNGKAMDFVVGGTRSFEVTEVALQLKLTEDSRPKLQIIEKTSLRPLSPVPLNHAAGLDDAAKPNSPLTSTLRLRNDSDHAKANDFVFVPEKPLLLSPGVAYRLALSTDTEKDGMLWLSGTIPKREDGIASHSGQFFGIGRGDPASWNSPSEVVNRYEIRGRWTDSTATSAIAQTPTAKKEPYAQYSGIYPHLAMFNTVRPGECGIGAVVNWAGRLWAVTYSPYHAGGSPDKLFQIDEQHHIFVHPESVGGTPANRMIHEESEQLIIGPYFIDKDRNVRVIPPSIMHGRHTGTARHLTDPANKVYYATMEEGFYEVDVHTLAVRTIHRDRSNFAHGNHGKGLYSGQGRVIYSNNGGSGHGDTRRLNVVPEQVGSLNEWDGTKWREVHRTGFLDITGPGGIRGNANPGKDPVWAIGWDYRSVILKVLDAGTWHTYRLPKASHTMDGHHGFNTEWPRIGEIGSDTERLIYVHGMFWRMPTVFSTTKTAGLRPRSTYLKMVSDSTKWGDRIVFACNDLSDEKQAIRLNPRKIRGNLTPSISHANLWFVEPEQIDSFGVPIGRGSVWMYDAVEAEEPSDAFQFGGWDRRLLHLSHGSEQPVQFAIEFGSTGNGKWETWKSVEVPGGSYLPVSLADAPDAEWIRLRTDRDAENVIATFHYANEDKRSVEAAPMFKGIARPGDHATGGLVRIKATDGAPLALATADGYFEMGSDMKLRSVDDPAAAEALRQIAEIPGKIEGPGGLTADAASVIYIDEEGGKRYRLPRGDAAFDQESSLGFERVDREVSRERNLFNAHGTFYELPYRNAGGFSLIRPVTTHNRRIKDFCSWRGLFVISGIDGTTSNPHIMRSDDRKAAVWVGALDDLWKMGKAVGIGGPWRDSAVKSGEPSDQYLMTGYDQKTLRLSHESDSEVIITVEVDITGYGDWKTYRSFDIPAGKPLTHRFPDHFNAYWVRTLANADTTATAQLWYE